MEEELRKLPMRSLPGDYSDRVMSHIAQAQARRRNALVTLATITFTLIIGIMITLPDAANGLVTWLDDPFTNLAAWIDWEMPGAMSDLEVIALVFAIVLCSTSALFLVRLNEQWTGATT
jgi:hypothetical protein